MRYRSRLAGVLVSLALLAGVSAAGVGGAGAQAAEKAAVNRWPALGHFQSPAVDRPQPAPELRVPTLGPHISGTTNTTESTNWSGYVDTGSTFSGVGGEWTVPAVQPSVPLAASSQWIGIDGATNSSLIQTGTSSITQNGGTQYFAWYEILPAVSMEIGVVSPGDDMQATIIQDSPGLWTITILDNTSQNIFSNQFRVQRTGELGRLDCGRPDRHDERDTTSHLPATLGQLWDHPVQQPRSHRAELEFNCGDPDRHDRRKLQYHCLSKHSYRERIHRHVRVAAQSPAFNYDNVTCYGRYQHFIFTNADRKWWRKSLGLVNCQWDIAHGTGAQRVDRCNYRRAHGGRQSKRHLRGHGCP